MTLIQGKAAGIGAKQLSPTFWATFQGGSFLDPPRSYSQGGRGPKMTPWQSGSKCRGKLLCNYSSCFALIPTHFMLLLNCFCIYPQSSKSSFKSMQSSWHRYKADSPDILSNFWRGVILGPPGPKTQMGMGSKMTPWQSGPKCRRKLLCNCSTCFALNPAHFMQLLSRHWW